MRPARHYKRRVRQSFRGFTWVARRAARAKIRVGTCALAAAVHQPPTRQPAPAATGVSRLLRTRPPYKRRLFRAARARTHTRARVYLGSPTCGRSLHIRRRARARLPAIINSRAHATGRRLGPTLSLYLSANCSQRPMKFLIGARYEIRRRLCGFDASNAGDRFAGKFLN